MVTMGTLLKMALEQKKYDLAAHILVYGLVKAKHDGKKERSKKPKSRLL
jgi:hypothetical protein